MKRRRIVTTVALGFAAAALAAVVGAPAASAATPSHVHPACGPAGVKDWTLCVR